jgi:streptomycin 6-kinase
MSFHIGSDRVSLEVKLDGYLRRWQLIPDGAPRQTHSSYLLPVTRHGVPAYLKIALEKEERRGSRLMAWWNGQGAAYVLEHDDDALLLERLGGPESLISMAADGRDDAASKILCAVAAKLHAARQPTGFELVPLISWFRELEAAALRWGGVLTESLSVSRRLLADQREIVVLHGDIHHGNVLDGGQRGWLAIDPKGLVGERGYDFANIFCNPNFVTSTGPGRLARQASVVATAAGLERQRLLQWILAYAGLSAAWSLGSQDESPATALLIAEIAASELGLTRWQRL